MINYIIKFSVRHKVFIFFMTALLIVWGMLSLSVLPIDAVPDITNNQVQINTSIAGWSAEEVEKTITFPIESAVRGIPNAKEVRSLSRLGLSQITIIFEDSMDIYLARQLVSERLQIVNGSLPNNVLPEMGPITTGLGEIYQYVVEYKAIETNSEERFKQLVELKSIQDWFIKPRLVGIPGVAEINSIGGYEKQIHIIPNLEKLSKYNISFADIENSVNNATQNVGGGYIEQDAEQFVVQAVGFLSNKEDVLNLPIKSLSNMQIISIKDVANVEYGKELRNGTATYNGKESVLGTIMMMTGENSRIVSDLVDKKIKEISKDLPENMEITTVYSRSELVKATIGTVWHNVVSGAFLVIIVLFLLAGNIRAAFITALSIPLTLIMTIIAMKYLNISGNLMSLGALDFGIIIDGVVIVVDHCMRKIKNKIKDEKNLSREDIDEIVINSTMEIRKAAGFGQLILVVVFLPIFSLIGIEAKTFQPMAMTFIIALIAALILSLTLTPALVAFLLRKNYDIKDPRFMVFLESLYGKLLSKSLNKSYLILSVALIFIVFGFGLIKHIGVEFVPQLNEGAFAFHLIRPQNVSLSMSTDLQKKAENIILEYPEVSHVFSRIGTADVATDPMGVNVSDTYIIFKNFGKGINFDEYAEMLLERLKHDLPAMTYLASQPIQMRFNELLEGSRADLTIKVFGNDLKKLEEIGEEIEELIKPISKTSDVELDRTSGSPMFSIEPNLDLLQKYGVKKSDILDSVLMSLSGKEVGYFFDENKKFLLVIRLDEENRKNIDIIKSLPIPTLSDNNIPLKNITNINFRETYSAINRDNGYRRATIMVNTRGIDTNSFVKEAQKVVKEKIELPSGYFIEWGGQYKNMQEASKRFMILIPLTTMAVFFMVYLALNSFKETALVFIGVPFALFGGIFSLYLSGMSFSISAAIGCIALMGISVLDDIVLVNAFSDEEYSGFSTEDRVINGSKSRLRAVLMTTLTDFLGFLPMALSSGIGSEVQKPLAIIIIGGTVTSTILTLFVLPNIYYKFNK